MANSNRKKILDHVVTTLAAITAGGGYNNTVASAARGIKHFNDVGAFPAFFVPGADEKRRNVTNREFRADPMISIVGYVSVADALDKPALEQAVDNLIEDATKALMADVTRGGLCVTTEITDIEANKGSWETHAGFEMIIRCEYRAATSAP